VLVDPDWIRKLRQRVRLSDRDRTRKLPHKTGVYYFGDAAKNDRKYRDNLDQKWSKIFGKIKKYDQKWSAKPG
jgi:hypothetical protein